MTAAALTVRGVRRRLGGRDVLVDVTLEVPAGHVVVLLGESGAGKSTLLRVVAGLDAPDAGAVLIGDRVVCDASRPNDDLPSHARGVGLVFQSLELWPHMTAAENVAFGLPGRPKGVRASRHPRVLEVARDVGLPEALLSRRPTTLSGGERQRVAIARAMAPSPSVLLYDEPLANLDPHRRGEIRALVRRLAAPRTATVLYVTHDPAEAMEVGDLVAVLAHGRVADIGPPQRVYARPRAFAAARAMGPVSALPARHVGGDRVHCALGDVSVDGPTTTTGLCLLRPDQIRVNAGTRTSGALASVFDTFVVPGAFAFRARFADGVVVEGRHAERLPLGRDVALWVEGAGVLVPPEDPHDGPFDDAPRAAKEAT